MSIMDSLKSIGIGGLTGYADATQDRGWYVPNFQYIGNGLARSDMDFLTNPKYRDYASGGKMLGTMLDNEEDNNNNGNIFGSLRQRLDTMLNKPMFQQETIYNYPLNTQEYKMPKVGGLGGNTIGGTNEAYNIYGLPVQQIQKPDWLKS